ncbi:F-box domain-containing protein, variant [Thozetella sp. PMI_491]|nr:F-box domain-containing protein, variant [Thozetella sp. PMI_491]
MASSPVPIDAIPNEILLGILDGLSTRDLLPLAQVSRHFMAAVLRILDHRLTQASRLPDQRLILECYHPSAKISTPYFFCDYLYTSPLEVGGTEEEAGDGRGLSTLNSLYSRFRPVVQEENRRARLRYPTQAQAAVQAGSQDDAGPSQPRPEPERPAHDIAFDDGELFSQLCTVANLVKVGPKRGLFLSHVNISDAVIRVWRHWLAEQAVRTQAGAVEGHLDDGILWADSRTRNVGLRFRVVEHEVAPQHGAPVLVGADEDLPVAYRLEYDELLVRTNQLLLMVEKSEEQEVATSGKAIVIASLE